MSRYGWIVLAAATLAAGPVEGQKERSPAGLESLRALDGLKGLAALQGLEGLRGLEELASLELLGSLELWDGPWSWGYDGQQDPADSLYRAARQALNAGRYQTAADQFRRVTDRYPRSAVAGDAMYWAAFSLYRLGGTQNLQTAVQVIQQQADRYRDARTRRDAEVLATRIRGELARTGDPAAAESIAVLAGPPAPPGGAAPAPPVPPVPPVRPAPPVSPGGRRSGRAAPPQGCEDQDYELRMEALNALLQMDAERALPILQEVLARRDPCSVELRRKAVFLVSQRRGADTEETLLTAARGDPDAEVRAQAVFWLSQVPTEQAVVALDSILAESSDRQVQEKAIFALSQHRSERAGQILRRYVERADAPEELRANAIFWLGQRRNPETFAYLRDLYPRVTSLELKEKVIFSMHELRLEETRRWLLDLANNRSESVEMRKKALFWAGQRRDVSVDDLARLYDTNDNREIKEQLIFVYSQRREPAAVDKLMSIAQTETDRELQKKAVFWLGQSRDPRAAEFLLRLINPR
ncbi:MAG TPA: HEAT repeat domain-containing protein [Gemmatimonadales bacterium]|nr:HEAT repeat domain-containing protein [Gemmatimonadales bacterium]